MRVVPSPLVASLHGSAAGVTAATWKGIQYIRRKVTPANPKSAAQVLVRESLARCVTLWRSLDADVKTWLNLYGADYRMSGYNVFMSKCRALEQAGSLLKPVPDSPYAPVPTDLAFAAGASGVITVTWTAGDVPAGYTDVQAVARLATGNIFNVTAKATDVTATLSLTGLTAATDYDCYAWYLDAVAPVRCGTSGGELLVTSGV